MLLWQMSIVEIDHGLFRVFGSYVIDKSVHTLVILDIGHLSDTPSSSLPAPYAGQVRPQAAT